MSDTTVKPYRGSRRRKILIFALAAFLVLLVARTVLDLWAGHRVDGEIARLERQYGSLGEHSMDPPHVQSSDNRARALRAAAALTVMAPNPTDFQRAFGPFLKVPSTGPMPTDLRTFVDANQSALRIADEARARRHANWEADYPAGTDVPPWVDLRALSNAIYLDARLELDAGRPDAAARAIASGLALSASVRQEPQLIAQLMRCAFATQQFEAVQRLVTQSEPSKTSLEELAKWLVENRGPDPIRTALLSELKYYNAAFARMEKDNVIRMPGAHDSPLYLGPLVRFSRPLIRLARVRYLEQMGHLLEVQAGPRPRPASGTPARWAFLRPMEMMPTAGLERTMDSGDLFNSELGVTELAVGLRRFRLDHGTYPDVLSALVPAYISRVPNDPFTGQPPVYTRQGAGFRLQAKNGKNFSATTAAALDWTVPK